MGSNILLGMAQAIVRIALRHRATDAFEMHVGVED